MKKTYQSPATIVVNLVNPCLLNNMSRGGVDTGSVPGDEYTQGDKTYSRRRRRRNKWDDEEEDDLDF
jgi:hypothetical protein